MEISDRNFSGLLFFFLLLRRRRFLKLQCCVLCSVYSL